MWSCNNRALPPQLFFLVLSITRKLTPKPLLEQERPTTMANQNSSFDPEAFLSSATVDGELSTEVTVCPEGTYRGQIGDRIDARQFTSEKSGTPRTFTVISINWEVLDDAVRAELDREHVYVRQDFFLDLDENGALDTSKGKNVDLGRLRAAVGQNDMSGWTFNNLKGAMATIQVRQRSDEKNPQRKYAEVARVAAID